MNYLHHQTLRDKIHNQVILNQKLLNYDYSSEQQIESQQQYNLSRNYHSQKASKVKKISSYVTPLISSNISNIQKQKQVSISFNDDIQTNLKRQRLFRQFLIKQNANNRNDHIQQNQLNARLIEKQNNYQQDRKMSSSLCKEYKQYQYKDDEDYYRNGNEKNKENKRIKKATQINREVLELKTKIAQLIKQNGMKDKVIKDLNNEIICNKETIEQLKTGLQQKQAELLSSEKHSLQQMHTQNLQIQTKSLQLQQQQRHFILELEKLRMQNQSFSQKLQSYQNKITEFKQLVKLKDQELRKIKKTEEKSGSVVKENQRLKVDVKRLIELLESYRGEGKSCRTKSFKNSTNRQGESYKNRTINSKIYISGRSGKQINNKSFLDISHSKNHLSPLKKHHRTASQIDITRLQSYHYLSVPSRNPSPNTLSCWYPTILINQVQCFLKRMHMGYNNTKFVNSLVQFINSYTQKCLQMNRNHMEKRYKSLKNDIRRRANECLSMREIFQINEKERQQRKERQEEKSLKKAKKQKSNKNRNIYQNHLKNQITFSLNQKKHSSNNHNPISPLGKASQQPLSTLKQLTRPNLQTTKTITDLSSQNISILKPVTNIEGNQIPLINNQKKEEGCYQIQYSLIANTKKDEVGYKNLERSIERHNTKNFKNLMMNCQSRHGGCDKNEVKNTQSKFLNCYDINELENKRYSTMIKSEKKSKKKDSKISRRKSLAHSVKKKFKTEIGNQSDIKTCFMKIMK